ncbi:unnamed protein product, partial [Ranitomeya imitator]
MSTTTRQYSYLPDFGNRNDPWLLECETCFFSRVNLQQRRLHPHTLPHEALSPHITTQGSVSTHYHTRLRPHTLPHKAPPLHITTRGSVPTHYHMRLHPHTLPHEALSPPITTRGSIPTHYHTMLRPPTLPHEAPSPHITTRGSFNHFSQGKRTFNCIRILPNKMSQEESPCPSHRPQEYPDNDAVADQQQQYRQNCRIGYQQQTPEQIDKDREIYHKVYINRVTERREADIYN